MIAPNLILDGNCLWNSHCALRIKSRANTVRKPVSSLHIPFFLLSLPRSQSLLEQLVREAEIIVPWTIGCGVWNSCSFMLWVRDSYSHLVHYIRPKKENSSFSIQLGINSAILLVMMYWLRIKKSRVSMDWDMQIER
jgi:hypothetical protein